MIEESIHRETREFKRNLKKLFTLFGFIILFSALYFYVYLKPSNERNWEVGFDTLPKITIAGNQITIKDLRDTQFDKDNHTSIRYLEKSVNLSDLERAWFVVEPFTIKPLTGFKGVAHTYLVFDFKNQDPIAISVEARREKGEKYDAWMGLLNQYELMYVWGTENDETVRRVIVEHNPLYMYPLTIDKEFSKKLFLQLALTTKELESTPRFYNSFFSNCTNELAKNANLVQESTIPNDIALILPGYSEQLLYSLHLIPNDLPLAEEQKKYAISSSIQEIYHTPDFSKELRKRLGEPTN